MARSTTLNSLASVSRTLVLVGVDRLFCRYRSVCKSRRESSVEFSFETIESMQVFFCDTCVSVAVLNQSFALSR